MRATAWSFRFSITLRTHFLIMSFFCPWSSRLDAWIFAAIVHLRHSSTASSTHCVMLHARLSEAVQCSMTPGTHIPLVPESTTRVVDFPFKIRRTISLIQQIQVSFLKYTLKSVICLGHKGVPGFSPAAWTRGNLPLLVGDMSQVWLVTSKLSWIVIVTLCCKGTWLLGQNPSKPWCSKKNTGCMNVEKYFSPNNLENNS